MPKYEKFQRIFMLVEPEALSLNSQASLGVVRPPQRSQFSLLVRHFLERFFNHETASPDGDAKARLILLAIGTGIPGFIVALYLWPAYHPFMGWPPGSPLNMDPPPYWLQVNHHFFFVLYSFVAMGIITVFEWDLFFPDLLDVFVLTTLPIQLRKLFLARVAAISIFIVGFLLDANFLAPLVIPASFEPTNVFRLLGGHILATLASGLYAAVMILALQGMLLSLLGEALFRRIALALQGLAISVLVMLLLLFPVLSGAVPVMLQSGSAFARYCPPFWFLGIYQRVLEGPSALPIYGRLAQTGCMALLITIALACLAYPLAYVRRTRQLVLGVSTRDTRSLVAEPINRLLHATLLRAPIRRAVFHFISQSLVRVQRYRIYLVLYGGVGLSVVGASLLRLNVEHAHIHMQVSADGMRATIGIVAFWLIAGLRMAFVSPGNQQGSWVFRIIHGRPPHLAPAMEELLAAKVWVLLCSAIVTLGIAFGSHFFAPVELRSWAATASLLLLAAGLCLLITDLAFLNVKIIAFTGQPEREESSLALTLLQYFTFFPLVIWLPVVLEPWIGASLMHFVTAIAAIAAGHLLLRAHHRNVIEEHCNMRALEDDEEDFPMKLGLRY